MKTRRVEHRSKRKRDTWISHALGIRKQALRLNPHSKGRTGGEEVDGEELREDRHNEEDRDLQIYGSRLQVAAAKGRIEEVEEGLKAGEDVNHQGATTALRSRQLLPKVMKRLSR